MKKELEHIFGRSISDIEEKELPKFDSISNGVALKNNDGIKRYKISFEDNTSRNVVLKHKNNKIIARGITLLSNDDPLITMGLLMNHKIFSYDNSYKREIGIYEKINPKFKKYMVNYLGYYKKRHDYYIVMDYVDSHEDADYKKVLDPIIEIGAFYYNREEAAKEILLNNYTPEDYSKSKQVLRRMFEKLDNSDFPPKRRRNILRFIDNIDVYNKRFAYHRTLSHNDFSMRNIFADEKRVYFYDWELAAFQNPEHDLVEYLIYSMKKYTDEQVIEIIRYFRDNLFKKIGITMDYEEYHSLLLFNIYEFLVNRLSMLRLAGNRIPLECLNGMTGNVNRLIDILGDERYE